jgi:hypothetical protein
MKIGVTGTEYGMTKPQMRRVFSILDAFAESEDWSGGAELELHHGDCEGVDEQAALLGIVTHFTVVGHPPINESKRARFPSDKTLPPKEYLARDKDIAREVAVLIVVPEDYEERNRSGTWYTARRARDYGKQLIIVYPDGTARNEDWTGKEKVSERA